MFRKYGFVLGWALTSLVGYMLIENVLGTPLWIEAILIFVVIIVSYMVAILVENLFTRNARTKNSDQTY